MKTGQYLVTADKCLREASEHVFDSTEAAKVSALLGIGAALIALTHQVEALTSEVGSTLRVKVVEK